jgi:hypothetical protein
MIMEKNSINPEIFANRCAGRLGALYKNKVVGRGRRTSVRLGHFADGASPEWLVAKTPRRGQLGRFEADVADAEGMLPLLAAFHKYIDAHFPEVSHQVLVKMNIPTIWRHLEPAAAGQGKKPLPAREVKMLVEPFVENLQYFNTNTGWAFEEAEILQALSHFSYHVSEGKKLLCDLQGAWLDADECYEVGAEHNYMLTNVSFMTSDWVGNPRNAAADSDFGNEGIENFFSLHRCNGFCSPSWKTWENPVQHFEPSDTSKLRANRTAHTPASQKLRANRTAHTPASHTPEYPTSSSLYVSWAPISESSSKCSLESAERRGKEGRCCF